MDDPYGYGLSFICTTECWSQCFSRTNLFPDVSQTNHFSSAWLNTLGAVHKGRPKIRGWGFGQMRTGGRGSRTLRTSASWHFSLSCQHALQTLSLWMMPSY